MAYIFRLNSAIPFTHTYYDSSGDALSPSTVTAWVTYATTEGFPYRAVRDTTYLSLTQNSTTLSYEGSWSSTGAAPGMVYWHIQASDSTLDVAVASS
jgi:hypothetical protein